jgi:Pyruvate/2-oxoacid:ferredoxin oxidoreductase delta subunit
MVLRDVIKIDESKCDGCGLCAKACAEKAIGIINGKAKLISQTYCDGLGVCLGHCPKDAITIEKQQAQAFDEQAVRKHLSKKAEPELPCGCPGTMTQVLNRDSDCVSSNSGPVESELSHWPVKIKLVSPNAPFLKNADVLLVGDCVPFAMGDFHKLLRDHVVLVGCPKLDDADYYVEKLAQIFAANDLESLSVIHMEVPCCFGLSRIAQSAVEKSGVKLKISDLTVSLKGKIL